MRVCNAAHAPDVDFMRGAHHDEEFHDQAERRDLTADRLGDLEVTVFVPGMKPAAKSKPSSKYRAACNMNVTSCTTHSATPSR